MKYEMIKGYEVPSDNGGKAKDVCVAWTQGIAEIHANSILHIKRSRILSERYHNRRKRFAFCVASIHINLVEYKS